MQELLALIRRFQALILCIVLLLVSFVLILRNNHYASASYAQGSSRLAGSVNNTTNEVRQYIGLTAENEALRDQNAKLLAENQRLRMEAYASNNGLARDAAYLSQYSIIPAQVINNQVYNYRNYITLNQGANAGIEPGMGVVAPQGVVGQVRSVSKHFASVTSLLHADNRISGLLKGTNTLCVIQWEGADPTHATLKNVPRHLDVLRLKGDTVVTSGFNAVFPPQILIGVVDSVALKENASFYDMRIKLSTPFQQVDNVFIIRNMLDNELDSLQNQGVQKP